MLKRKAPKIIQISDIVEWYEKGELDYSPKYQRNSVWNEKAKSYLIDSIIRGLPIPPIFMRQTIDVNTRKTYREIIDGQQRIRAIIDFINDKVQISKMHNEIYGGKVYSLLDDETKAEFLEYDLFAEIINETEDSVIYDMFARLNTNNCVLNAQELRNAKYWGEFKVASYNNAAEYRTLFEDNKIFSDKQFSRMLDVEFISSLLNVIINGIETETPKAINKLYEKYDKEFESYSDIKEKFDLTMATIDKIYDYLNGNVVCFTSKTYFYTLFVFIYHQLYGVINLQFTRKDIFSKNFINENIETMVSKIVEFENMYEKCICQEDVNNENYVKMSTFVRHHKTRTTNKEERMSRVEILNNFIVEA